MQHLVNPEQPAFTAENVNDAYMLEFVAREYIGDDALTQQMKLYRQTAVNGKPEAAQQVFVGDEAALLLQGLGRVINTLPKEHHRRGIAQDMVKDYEQSLAEAEAEAEAADAPRLVAAA